MKKYYQKLIQSSKLKITTYINFADIEMANGKMGFDSPMSLLAQISYNANCEFVVRYVYCFPIISSNYGWRPPTNMLWSQENNEMLDIMQEKTQIN